MNMTKWESQSTRDTGNGALIHVSSCPEWSGVKQYEFVSYCRREENKTWYEAVGDDSRLEYSTPSGAAARYAECVKLRDQSAKIKKLESQLSRR